MTDITLPAAAGAGLLSFLSPCVLPLAPPYLCYLAGTSVEALAEEAVGETFQLGRHGRYSHSRAYLEHVMSDAGFEPPGIDTVVLRQELGQPVRGYLVSGRRSTR